MKSACFGVLSIIEYEYFV